MFHIPWKDRYNIHYKEIDDQHRGLLVILNELVDLQGEENEGGKVVEIFHRLCAYALNHFATEERYLMAAGYAHLERQQTEHAEFIQDLLALNQRFEPGDPQLAVETFEFVKDWYLQHILKSDMDYVATLKSYRAHAEIKGVIFDLSEVLCAVDETRFLGALAVLDGGPVEVLEARVTSQPSLFQGYAAGFLETPEFLSALRELCDTNAGEDSIVEAYVNVFRPKEETLALLPRLKTRFKLGLIADTTPLRFERGLASLPWMGLFDVITLPWAVKATKPELPLFNDCLDRLGLLAEECIYVDDQPAMALAASGHLLHGVAAPDAERLVQSLRRHKIDV